MGKLLIPCGCVHLISRNLGISKGEDNIILGYGVHKYLDSRNCSQFASLLSKNFVKMSYH